LPSSSIRLAPPPPPPLFPYTTLFRSVLAFGLSAATQGKQGAGPSVDQNDKYQVKIDNFSFMPASLTVPAGTKVTWTNHDDVPHKDRKSTRLNSSHQIISYAVFCLKKK